MAMTIEEIDDYQGALVGLLPMLEECIQTARREKNYDSSVILCGGTRSAFIRIHDECTFHPNTAPEILEKFVNSFNTAIFELQQVMPKSRLDKDEKDHLEGMISNMQFRVKMLGELMKVKMPIEERMERVDIIGTAMEEAQASLRLKQSRELNKPAGRIKNGAC